MKHSKSSHRFNLVRYLNKPTDHSLIEEEVDSSMEGNMFENGRPQPLKVIKFEPNRSFQFVGVKQLKSYYEKLRRPNRESKKISTAGLGLARLESFSRQKEEHNPLMSEYQLLRKRGHDSRMNDSPRPIERNQETLNKSKLHSSLYQTKRTSEERSSYSVQKIKKQHRNYEEMWEAAETKGVTNKGFPSIIKLSTEEREKLQMKEMNSHRRFKENFQTEHWQTVLRNGDDYSAYFRSKDRSKVKIRKNLLNIYGKNKLESETSWVHQKGDEGYQFKQINK